MNDHGNGAGARPPPRFRPRTRIWAHRFARQSLEVWLHCVGPALEVTGLPAPVPDRCLGAGLAEVADSRPGRGTVQSQFSLWQDLCRRQLHTWQPTLKSGTVLMQIFLVCRFSSAPHDSVGCLIALIAADRRAQTYGKTIPAIDCYDR